MVRKNGTPKKQKQNNKNCFGFLKRKSFNLGNFSGPQRRLISIQSQAHEKAAAAAKEDGVTGVGGTSVLEVVLGLVIRR